MNKKQNLLGQGLLFSATLAWGVSFTVLKNILETMSMYYLMGVRFLVASILLAIIFHKHFKNLNKGALLRGLLLGVVLTIAYITQTFGLMNTTPGENAFLTSTYSIMCPFLLFVIFKRKPKIYNLIAAILCVVGIALIALSNSGNNEGNAVLGYSLTLVAALFFAFQILVIDQANLHNDDSMLTLILELFVVGVVFAILSLIIDLPKGIEVYSLNLEQILVVLLLTFLCTLYAQFAQIKGMQYTQPNQAAIILSLESVFGTIFSIIMGEEKTSLMMFIGFIIIFIAMMFTELKLDPRRLFLHKKQ